MPRVAKNIAPLIQAIQELPEIQSQVHFQDTLSLSAKETLSKQTKQQIYELAQALKPWRKGPFDLFGILIDSEWRSFKKYELISQHFSFRDKEIADVGCNNGYYMFRLLQEKPKSITGFDPYALFKCQFDFINHFIKSEIHYELLGVQDLPSYGKSFDLILCMGVLYHRTDPIATLKALAKSLKPNGEVVLDTLILDSSDAIALCPPKSYAKMSNAYFIPSPSALAGWCERAGFESIECLAQVPTDTSEQRKTEWIDTMSLEDFLHPLDPKLTIEGYQAPLRGYFKLKRRKHG